MSTEHPLDAVHDLTGEEYAEAIAEFKADKAAYCRAVDTEGCACIPRPNYPVLADRNRWCRKHGILVTVPAELTQSVSGIRGGEPCMVHTRVPVEDVSTLLEDGATWEQVKDIYPSIPTPNDSAAEEAPTEYRCPNCHRWALWTDGVVDGDDEGVEEFWCQTCGCQTAVEDMESRPAPSMPVPAAQPGAGDAETAGTGSGRGTGGTELHISAEAFQDSTQWTIPADEIHSLAAHGVIRSKHSVRFEPEPDYPPALIPTESLPSLARFINALKAQHYLDAAASLRNLGHTAAAERLESYVRDLDEEGR